MFRTIFLNLSSSIDIRIENIQFIPVIPFSGSNQQKNEMGGACSAYGGEERCVQGFGGET